jgi:hypothetical protein
VQKRKSRHEQEDRDKTLEPNDIVATHPRTLHPLAKSSTSAVLKLDRDLGYSSSHKERTPYRLSGRHKNKYLETVLDGNNNRTSPKEEKYQKSYAPTAASDYVGARLSKESTYKSKYDPDTIYSDLATNGTSNGSGNVRRRQYRRNDSDKQHQTAINLYELDADRPTLAPRRDYTQRKSATSSNLYQRARTQQFADIDSSATESDERDKERENKRKEIQSLIQKYAQLDDFYGKGTDTKEAKADKEVKEENNDSAYHSPVQHERHLQKSQTMHNLGPSSHYNNHNMISYDNATWVQPMVPSVRSRIPKLSSFVRNDFWLSLVLRCFCTNKRITLFTQYFVVFAKLTCR